MACHIRLSVLVVALSSAVVWGQSFNVDVGQPGSQPPSTYAAAGLPGVWNSVTAAHVTPFTTGPTPDDDLLVDIFGNPTTVGFHQFGGMDLQTVVDPTVTGDDATLLRDYLATHSVPLEDCMYLNGLQPGTYEVITYAWMPNSPFTMQQVRFDNFPGTDLVGGSWNGEHVEGITYNREVFEVTDGHIGWHVGIPAGGATEPGAAFNGFQVRLLGAPVPAASEWGIAVLTLLMAGMGTLAFRPRPL
ncbi:MAG: IPTL-CTERM sorting domain-containing protein [Phycisphaerae bacterium]